jgi:hypothetical protein
VVAPPPNVRQEDAAAIPRCQHCHPLAEQAAEIRMPSLKGALHRQCLNCHLDWSGTNDCVVCHKPRDGKAGAAAAKAPPTKDDIVGRMHPPVPAPQTKAFKTRFTPADGGNVLFRHEEHATAFGLKCVSCHRHDNCSHCHDPKTSVATTTVAARPAVPSSPILRPSETWKESHGPCLGCHEQDHCRSCHYKDDQTAPPPFEHNVTGQVLDVDHVKLTCLQCHTTLRSKAQLTCGGAECHKKDPSIAYPFKRPGPVLKVATPTTQGLPGPGKGIVR